MPEGRMRCSANGASLRHKATFFALKTVPLRVTYTSSPPAGGAVSLRLGQARVLVPTGNQFNTAPLLRSPQGEAKVGVVPRGSQTNTFRPNTETFSAVHNIAAATGRTRSPGGLGGCSRLEFIISPPLPAAK